MPISTELKVRMDPSTKKELEDLAASLGMSKSQVVREGIRVLKREQEKRAALENLNRMADKGGRRRP